MAAETQLESKKLAKGALSYNDDGSVQCSEDLRIDKYFYLGDEWRIVTNNSGNNRKLQFEYREESGSVGNKQYKWRVGLPLIRPQMVPHLPL
jgi:hypothetical protein